MSLLRHQRGTIQNTAWCAIVTALAVWPASAATIGATSANPQTVQVGVATDVTVTSTITDPSLIANSVVLQKLNASGQVIAVVGTLHDDGLAGDAVAGDNIYSIRTTVYETAPGSLTLRVAAGFKGSLLLTFAPPMPITIAGAAVGISIDSPANLLYTNLTPVNVTGTAGANATVKINGVNAPVTNGRFLASIPLVEGLNTLTAVATNTGGVTTTASVQVTLDTTPPHLTIDSPQAGTTTTASSVTVTGTANDVVVGTVNSGDVQVTVNGILAQVANRTYSAANVPLAVGLNTIQAVGRDRAGNGTTVTMTITRALPSAPPSATIGASVIVNSLSIVSGNSQTATIGTKLPLPLVVALVNSAGAPLANQAVVFSVTGNNGLVTGVGAPAGSAVVNTGANGQAQVFWTLGQRSGAGINTVQASAATAVGPVTFTATGTTAPGTQINVDSGNTQTGALNQALAFPLVAVVTDAGHNRVPNVSVTFTVTQGGGTLNGLISQLVKTDSNGRAIAVLTLGSEAGNDNNVVQANFPGNPGTPAVFTASGRAPGNPAATTISGVVLDNSNNPIQGVTMRLFQTNQASNNNLPMQIGTPVQTNAQGSFVISQAPVGFYKLMADGTTAVSPKSYPTIEYDLVTVAGQDNTVGTPIYLPALDTVNKLCVDATHGGTLTLPQSPGFSLTVLPGSATFPGGARSGCVTVSTVNGDKVPMAPGFGQQPRFIVSIQPVGTIFNPPAPMTIPNVDGLAPRAVTEMYSYDHDLGMFVAIGTGTVSNDGSAIATNPGVGVLKAGWHCGGDPNASGNVADCGECKICQGSQCANDDSQKPKEFCSVCKNGKVTEADLGWKSDASLQASVTMPESVKAYANGLVNKIPGLEGVTLTEVKGQITGKIADCCDPQNGNITPNGAKEISAGISLEANLGKWKLWPPGVPNIDYKTTVFDAFGVVVQIEVVFQVGVFLESKIAFTGQGGVRSNSCKGEDCGFGSLGLGWEAALFPEITAVGCIDSTETNRYCTDVFTVKPLQLSVKVEGSAGYNVEKCGQGLSACGAIGNVQLSMDIKVGSFSLSPQYTVYGGLLKGCVP
jgi:hypothetical protein